MPVDFDESDIDDVVDEVEHQAQQPTPQNTDNDGELLEEQMNEVEQRLEMAQYYRLVLSDSIFNDPPNPAVAERVETEIREFIRERMAVLVGLGEPKKNKAIFTDGEVQALRTLAQVDVTEALKALAAKVLKKPAILEAKPLPENKPKIPARLPTLKKVARGGAPPRPPPTSLPSSGAKRSTKTGKQKQVLKTETNSEGKEFVRDLTPQARPIGIQPLPTPTTKEAIQASFATSAHLGAASAASVLESRLTGKIRD